MSAEVRPLSSADVDGVLRAADAAFRALDGRQDDPAEPPERIALFRRRHEHLLATDPDGQWVAVDDGGTVLGAACSLRRAGLWGLSLLVVRPEQQSAGLGRRLIEAALTTYGDARGGLIMSSGDPRALRRYGRAGFALHPALGATGVVRRAALRRPHTVRDGDAGDLAAAEPVSLAVRGASHGADLAVLLDTGGRLLVADGGYAIVRERRLTILAATAPDVAADLLTAALLSLPADQEAEVHFVTGAQQWALPVLLDAGLALRADGAVCTRGDVGPLTPYLPSGAYL